MNLCIRYWLMMPIIRAGGLFIFSYHRRLHTAGWWWAKSDTILAIGNQGGGYVAGPFVGLTTKCRVIRAWSTDTIWSHHPDLDITTEEWPHRIGAVHRTCDGARRLCWPSSGLWDRALTRTQRCSAVYGVYYRVYSYSIQYIL